ncbi:MAG: MotA/TolQ/ExbB proton channel family protein [Actinomycetota bacterium]|nr:MotA/TolQ/ExbB proton channel family protein [Actinomycetota bacterium]MDI6821770.1 MotA/TolQ/ExbB proton channel family protein [Actinomycetota bacterium]
MIVPGSEFLSKALHLISQSLLIPDIIGLLICITFAVIELGSLVSEYSQRTKVSGEKISEIIKKLHETSEIREVISANTLSQNQRNILEKIVSHGHLTNNSLNTLARKLIEEEELKAAQTLEKTDMLARWGPALGLMGTLIPLGPGLAALGRGDVQTLAQAVIIAFDTTIVGLAAGCIGYTISKIRKRWYEEHISTLEALVDPLLEVLENDKKAEDFTQIRRGY